MAISASLGDVYGSELLGGFSSRPLRETEFHERLSKTQHAFHCDVKWVYAPTLNDDEESVVEPIPVLLPSEFASWEHQAFCYGFGV